MASFSILFMGGTDGNAEHVYPERRGDLVSYLGRLESADEALEVF
jgi:hypothetical protein